MVEDKKEDKVPLLAPPHQVQVQFGADHHIILPAVYRYEDKRWIDRFFDHGELRLSTFAKFATYPDEVRGDRHEGVGMSYGEADGKAVSILGSEGVNCLIFCTTLHPSQKLQSEFGRDSIFVMFRRFLRKLPKARCSAPTSCAMLNIKLVRSFLVGGLHWRPSTRNRVALAELS